MKRGLVLIAGSVHDVPERIYTIDSRYEVYYNKRKSRYEIHAKGFVPSLQLVIPFKQLDSRTVDYVSSTRMEKQLERIKRMDEDNERMTTSRASAILDKMEYKTKSLMSYVNGGGEEIPAYEEM